MVRLGQVANGKMFAIKVGGTICATNALGAFLYWRGTRRAAGPSGHAEIKGVKEQDI